MNLRSIHDRARTSLTGCPSADELDELEVGGNELGAVSEEAQTDTELSAVMRFSQSSSEYWPSL